MTDEILTSRQAYIAMVEFLHAYMDRGETRELVLLVHDVTLDTDGMPNDPAMWQDWLEALNAARRMASEGTDATRGIDTDGRLGAPSTDQSGV